MFLTKWVCTHLFKEICHLFPIRINMIRFCIYIHFMHRVFGTFCLRPSNGSHLSTEKGTNSWTPVMWDSRGLASAVSLQSRFPFPNFMCNLSLCLNRFLAVSPSVTFFTLFFFFSPELWNDCSSECIFFATLETCLFSHKQLFQKLCQSESAFSPWMILTRKGPPYSCYGCYFKYSSSKTGL